MFPDELKRFVDPGTKTGDEGEEGGGEKGEEGSGEEGAGAEE